MPSTRSLSRIGHGKGIPSVLQAMSKFYSDIYRLSCKKVNSYEQHAFRILIKASSFVLNYTLKLFSWRFSVQASLLNLSRCNCSFVLSSNAILFSVSLALRSISSRQFRSTLVSLKLAWLISPFICLFFSSIMRPRRVFYISFHSMFVQTSSLESPKKQSRSSEEVEEELLGISSSHLHCDRLSSTRFFRNSLSKTLALFSISLSWTPFCDPRLIKLFTWSLIYFSKSSRNFCYRRIFSEPISLMSS